MMDEIERRKAYEALLLSHREEMLRKAGLKPLDTKPLPELLSTPSKEEEEKPKDVQKEAPEEETQEEAKPFEMFEFDTFSPPPEAARTILEPDFASAAPIRDEKPRFNIEPVVELGEEKAPPYKPTLTQEQKEAPRLSAPKQLRAADEIQKKEVEPAEGKRDARPKPNLEQKDQPSRDKPVAPSEKQKAEFFRQVEENRGALREQARAYFQSEPPRPPLIRPGLGISEIPKGHDSGSETAVADAVGNFTAATSMAIAKIVSDLNTASDAIRRMVKTLEDGAS